MLILLLNIVFGSVFILALRWVQRGDDDILNVGAINYIIGGLFSTLVFIFSSDASYSISSCVAGAVSGMGYFFAFFFLMASMHWKGAALTAVVSRLAILLPLAGGIILWGERPSTWQSLGIGMACVSLVIVGVNKGTVRDRHLPWYVPFILGGFFLFAGTSRFAQEAFKYVGAQNEKVAFVLTGFALAGASSLVLMVVRRKGPSVREVCHGAFIGIANVLQTWCMLKALEFYDGYIVFPVTSAGGLLLTVGVAVALFGERLTVVSYLGILLAAGSLVLLHGFSM